MKVLERKNGYFMGIFALIVLLSAAPLSGYSQKRSLFGDSFYPKVATLKPEMTKEEVKSILGEPYKLSFLYTEAKNLTEELFYKSTIYHDKWYVITYRCMFVNGKLRSLTQKEQPMEVQSILLEDNKEE